MDNRKLLGNRGEKIAKDFLLKKGYTLIAQNYRQGHLEIDLIFETSKQVVFVEVKTRLLGSVDYYDNPLTQCQNKSLQRALIIYCVTNNISLDLARLDLIIILADTNSQRVFLKHYLDILN